MTVGGQLHPYALHNGRKGYYVDCRGFRHQHHSLLEYQRMQTLDRAGLRFRREPVRIKYSYQSRLRIYIPDLLVFNRWMCPEWIEEIKPDSLTGDPQNKAKWAAATFYAERIGLHFRVVTEKSLRVM